MLNKASALIYTREKHIGFPGGWFKVQPEDFPKATAKRLLDDYAMAAMEDVKQLRSAHKQVSVVIVEDGYVILGIAAYLRDLFSDGWEGVDERNRPVYGFFGYVWKQKDFNQCCYFPTLDQFANLVSDYIRPNWDLSKNSHWATHQELVPYQYSPCTIPNEAILDFTPHEIEAVENADKLVQWAINKAVSGESVSVSTNVTIYDIKTYTTPYQYVSQVVGSNNHTSKRKTQMMSKASALIFSKVKYYDLGYCFKIQPEDFTEKTAELIRDYALVAMDQFRRTSHEPRKVVVAVNGFVVLGVVTRLSDMFSDGWEGKDEFDYPIAGFYGYVWKQNEFTQVCSFPELSDFARPFEEYIRPNWETSRHSNWHTYPKLVPYQYTPCKVQRNIDMNFTPECIESPETAERLVQWAIQKAANGDSVSVCTNVSIYAEENCKMPFEYVSCDTSNRKNNVNRSTVKTRKRDKSEVNEDVDHLENNKEVVMLPRNDVSKISDLVDIPQKKSKKAIPRALIGIGILLLILVLVSTPVAWMAGILWKMLLVGAVACISVGIIRLLQDRKKQEEKTDTDRAIIEAKQPSSPIVVDPLKAGAKVEKIEKKPMVKLDRPKKPEEETTEDLFRF